MTRTLTHSLLIGTAGLALSGCSWLGMGGPTYTAPAPVAAPGVYAPAAAPCCQPRLSKWNLEGGVGPSFLAFGDAVTGEEAHAQLGADLRDLSMDTVYQDGVRVEAGVSKALAPNTKLSLTGNYTNHDSEGVVDWGTIGGERLTGGLSDYTSYGAEAGLRQYGRIARAPLVRSVRPYVEGRLGASYVEGIDVVGATLAGAPVAGGADIGFYEGGWVPTAAGLVGVETPFIGNSTIGLETGLRYSGKLEADEAIAPTSPLAGSNNGASRWSVPVMLRGRYRF